MTIINLAHVNLTQPPQPPQPLKRPIKKGEGEDKKHSSHEDWVTDFLAEGETIAIPLRRKDLQGQHLILKRTDLVKKMEQLYRRKGRALLRGEKPTFHGIYEEAKNILIANHIKRLTKKC